MDRPIIEPLEQIRSYDQSWGWVYPMIGVGDAQQLLLGTTETVIAGLGGTQTASPSLTINIAAGLIAALAPVDATTYGAIAANGQLIMQQGYYPGGTETLTNACGGGQSQWILIEASFSQIDVIPADDPDSGIPPYVNVENPAAPFAGQNNSGLPQDTVRRGVLVLTVKPGAPATTGSEMPPIVDSGAVPVYLIHLTSSQVTITNGEILVAGPNIGTNTSGYPQAPFCPGLIGQLPGSSGSHHGGIAGQAAKILFTNGAEIQGIAPYGNLPCSNASPSAIGGNIIEVSLSVLTITIINPNGNIGGNVGDTVFNKTLAGMWVCTTSGSSSTAVWTEVTNPFLVTEETSDFTVVPGGIHICNSASQIIATVPAASSFGQLPFSVRNIGSNTVVLTPTGSDAFETNAGGAVYNLPPSAAVKFGPVTGAFFEVL